MYCKGEWIFVEDKGKNYKCKVIDVKGNRLRVHYHGWKQSYDEWVDQDSDRINNFDMDADTNTDCLENLAVSADGAGRQESDLPKNGNFNVTEPVNSQKRKYCNKRKIYSVESTDSTINNISKRRATVDGAFESCEGDPLMSGTSSLRR